MGVSAGMFEGVFGVVFVLFAVAFVVVLALVVAVFALVLWRGFRGPEDAAVAELKRRLADGEISPIEYQARLDAIRRER
jgi:uncharacterized membrane protein